MTKLLEEAIIKMKKLPESEQERIAQIILNEVESETLTPSSSKSFSLENQPFVGMWKDRKEMQDSSEWVRQLRREQWRD